MRHTIKQIKQSWDDSPASNSITIKSDDLSLNLRTHMIEIGLTPISCPLIFKHTGMTVVCVYKIEHEKKKHKEEMGQWVRVLTMQA